MQVYQVCALTIYVPRSQKLRYLERESSNVIKQNFTFSATLDYIPNSYAL